MKNRPVFAVALFVSLLLHATGGYSLGGQAAAPDRIEAFEAGNGNDKFQVEAGIAIEGIVKLGDDLSTIQTAALAPVEATPPPPPEEIKPVEELHDAVTSTAPEAIEEKIVKTVEPPPPTPVEQPKPDDIKPQEQQPQQVAMLTEASSGHEQHGGDATVMKEYHGKLSKIFQSSKFSPNTKLKGKVEVSVTIGSDGKMLSRQIKTSSGHQILDNTAIAIVDRAAAEFEGALPKGLVLSQFSITQPFDFTTR